MQTERNKPEVKADPNKFDTITHHWDASGRLLRKNLYTLYGIDGNSYFERPINSGNLFFGNNQPAGRMEKQYADNGAVIKKQLVLGAPHKEYTPKLEGDDALRFQLEEERAQSEKLRMELTAIKKERDREPYERGDKAPEKPNAKEAAVTTLPGKG